jgi:hypothetical protein
MEMGSKVVYLLPWGNEISVVRAEKGDEAPWKVSQNI